MIEWITVAAIIATVVYAITIYNYLVRDRQRTRAGWSDIEVQLKRRHDLIPKLVDAVKQYAAYEQATLDQVTTLRNKAVNPNGVEQPRYRKPIPNSRRTRVSCSYKPTSVLSRSTSSLRGVTTTARSEI
jgi:hypothetical protein